MSTNIEAKRKGNVYTGDEEPGSGAHIVDISDFQMIINYITGHTDMPDPESPEFWAADLNEDGVIDIADAIQVANIIMTGDPEKSAMVRRSRASFEYLNANVVATNGTRQRIALSLENVNDYSAFQLDVVLPQGMHVVGESLSDARTDTHSITTGSVNGNFRIVAATIINRAFKGNDGELLYIDVETDSNYRGGSVRFDNAIFAMRNGETRLFQVNGEATGIMERMSNMAGAAKEKVYNMGGRMMDAMKKGINIIRRADGTTEKVIKK
jgi:hypothetical protein